MFDPIMLIGGLIAVILLTLIVMKRSGIPPYSDPFGERSQRLSSEKGISAKWRKDAVEDVAMNYSKADAEPPILKMAVGEFGKGMRSTAADALKLGMKVEVVCGPLFQDGKESVANLSKLYPERFKFMMLPKRPPNHFCIIGNNLFLDYQHPTHRDEFGGYSFGIRNAKIKHLREFQKRFEDLEEQAESNVDLALLDNLSKEEILKEK
jgi:hypothetical protein